MDRYIWAYNAAGEEVFRWAIPSDITLAPVGPMSALLPDQSEIDLHLLRTLPGRGQLPPFEMNVPTELTSIPEFAARHSSRFGGFPSANVLQAAIHEVGSRVQVYGLYLVTPPKHPGDVPEATPISVMIGDPDPH